MATFCFTLSAVTVAAASGLHEPPDSSTCNLPGRAPSLMQLNAATAAMGDVSTTESRKPLRIGGMWPGAEDTSSSASHSGDTEHIGFDSEGLIWEMPCGKTLKVNESFNIDASCPAACPLHAIDSSGEDFCKSVCVAASDSACATHNPEAPIADMELGTCREPAVTGCRRLSTDGTDTCLECDSFRYLAEGKCHTKYMWALWSAVAVSVLVIVVLIAYAIDLNVRPITNGAGLKDALAFRSAQKYRMPNFDGTGRHLYPIMTNLCSSLVGGPGLALHFRSQAAMVVWSFVVALGWVIFAYAIDVDMLVLGTRPYGHEFKNCVLVAWGHVTQQRLMWSKVLFVKMVYALTFIGSLIFGVMQLRFFQQVDYDHDTMKDYAAKVSGLPQVRGDEPVENELKECIAEACGLPVVGVSICWDYGNFEDKIKLEMMKSVEELQAGEVQPASPESQPAVEEMGVMRRSFFKLERMLLQEDDEQGLSDHEMKQMLDTLTCSSEAFIVFETEESRDKAVEALSGGLQFRGNLIMLAAADVEPHGVCWENFNNSGLMDKVATLCKGFVFIGLGFIAWSCLFYAPYAWAIFSFNYAGGRMPGTVYSLAFSAVVCIGNASMAEICSRVSDYMGFRYKDSREKCYMILYLIAVSLNIILDLWTTYFMAYSIMVGLNMRTFEGSLLPEVEWFMDRFESYAMQRSLGQNLFEYAMPSTFILPFIAEPIGVIYLFMRIFILIVRSHPHMKRWTSRLWLRAVDLELGRYADCLLNVFVAILAFFFPGGYILPMFLCLGLSHAYIYALDHWRVLRVVPRATFSSMDVDWWCQVMFAPICGLLLSCIVFKANCQTGSYCFEVPRILPACIAAFVLHCVVHVLLLAYVVPLFGRVDREGYRSGARTYEQVSAAEPCSWFSANPVHCLRSKFVHGHSPPCSYYIAGQEHTMQVNKSIGCYYTEEEKAVEDASSYEISHDSIRALWTIPSWGAPAAQEETETENSAR